MAKTVGTRIVQEHRPKMNKLTDEQRQELMAEGLRMIHGKPAKKSRAHRS